MQSIINFLLLVALTIISTCIGHAGEITQMEIDLACSKYQATDCTLVKAIIKQESGGKLIHKKVMDKNGRYSYGLMQVQYPTAKFLGFKGNPTLLQKTSYGLKFGIKYLEYQMDRYHGDLLSVISAYNAGSARRLRNGHFVNDKYVREVLAHYTKILNNGDTKLSGGRYLTKRIIADSQDYNVLHLLQLGTTWR